MHTISVRVVISDTFANLGRDFIEYAMIHHVVLQEITWCIA